jgi:hypothetical protein
VARTPLSDAPTTSRRPPAADNGPVTGSAGRGWGALRTNKSKSKVFAKDLRIPAGDEVLVKFLDDEPFDSYYRHWLNGRKGKQSFVCLGEDCPLCAKGDNPTFLVLFNVVDMIDDPSLVKVWAATPNPAGAIEEMALSEKYSPINRENLYFSVSKAKGSNGFFSYKVQAVKDRDLPDDWDIQPLTGDDIAKLVDQRHGSEYIRADTREALQEIADSLPED